MNIFTYILKYVYRKIVKQYRKRSPDVDGIRQFEKISIRNCFLGTFGCIIELADPGLV